jgi:hypothetical protein
MTTTPVQPLGRSNNSICQPAIVKRQHYSPPTSALPSSSAITSTTYQETRPSTAAMITTIESNRYENLQGINEGFIFFYHYRI